MLSISLLIIYNFTFVQQKIKENQYNELINDLRKDVTSFDLWVNEKISILNTAKDICSNFTYEEITKEKNENPFLNINHKDLSISAIYIGLSDGSFITGGQWIPPDDYDPRTRIWYIEAYEADETIISKPYIDQETGDAVITISSPLYLEGHFVGVISADVFLKDIKSFLSTQIEKDSSYSTLIDEDGTIIIHSRQPHLEGKNIKTDVNIPVLVDYFNELKQNPTIIRMSYTYDNEKILGIAQKVDGRNWYLAVTKIDNVTILNHLSSYRQILFINILIVLIIATLIYIIMRWRLELYDANQLLKAENEIDFLTGIYNRRYLNLYLENLWQKKQRDPIGLLILDVDYFKKYNDTYGHILGDEVLKKITQCMHETIRKSDVLARFGGEEFIIILDRVDVEESKKIAHKIIDAVYQLNIKHETSPFERVTISIGLMALEKDSALGVREAIECADKALYVAKEKGRNRISLFEE